MKYATYLKAKEYSMTNIVPAFRKNQVNYPLLKEKNIFYKYAKQLAECGTQKIIAVCQDCKTPYFDGAYMCKNRFCPVCQKQKSLILYSKLFPVVKKLIKEGYFLLTMTFTIKDTEYLEDGLWLIKNAFRTLTHQNKQYAKVFENMFIGGIRSLEVKRGLNSGKWHPHFHALVIKKIPTRDKEILDIMWNKILRNLLNNSNKNIYGLKYFTNEKIGDIYIKSLNTLKGKSLIKAVYDCIKYITKYNLNLESDLPELLDNLRNIRTIDSWGILRGLEDKAEEQPMSLAQTKEMVCKKCGSKTFDILDGITLEELSAKGYKDSIEDFDTEENKYDEE